MTHEYDSSGWLIHLNYNEEWAILAPLAMGISLELKMELFNPKNWELFEFQFEQIILN